MDARRRRWNMTVCAVVVSCGLAELSSCSGAHTGASASNRPITSLLLKAGELPDYGTGQLPRWTVATDGGQAPSPMCPSHPLSKLRSQGYATVTFDPESNSAPELIEELVRSGSAAAEFAACKRSLTTVASSVCLCSSPGTHRDRRFPGPSRPCHFPPKATRAWPDCKRSTSLECWASQKSHCPHREISRQVLCSCARATT